MGKWPKRHSFVVEECEALSVSDLPALDSRIKDLPLIGPKITIYVGGQQTRDATIEVVLGARGKFVRRYLKCPHCHSARETLYRTPRSQVFACRACWGLVFASQRYGRKHPLRGVATPRKREGQRRHPARQPYVWSGKERLRSYFRNTGRARLLELAEIDPRLARLRR